MLSILKNENFEVGIFAGYRNNNVAFPTIDKNEDIQEINRIYAISNSHFGNIGLTSMLPLSRKRSIGLALDFLVFLAAKFDIFHQNRITSNLDIIYQKQSNDEISESVQIESVHFVFH